MIMQPAVSELVLTSLAAKLTSASDSASRPVDFDRASPAMPLPLSNDTAQTIVLIDRVNMQGYSHDGVCNSYPPMQCEFAYLVFIPNVAALS